MPLGRPLCRKNIVWSLLRGAALLSLALTVVACQAVEPPLYDVPPIGAGQGKYATVGRCFAPNAPGACPGSACGQNAVGLPDNKVVELQGCGTLDAIFTGGTVLSVVGRPDLAIHIGENKGGSALIEASEDGFAYTIVGYINSAPAGTSPRCIAKIDGQRVLVDMSSCHVIFNVVFIRLSKLSPTVGISIDAVEALSFKPRR